MCSRSSVSAERLISQAKAGEPAQKMAKKKRDEGAGRIGRDRDGEADQGDDDGAVHHPVIGDRLFPPTLCACEAVRHSSRFCRLTNIR